MFIKKYENNGNFFDEETDLNDYDLAEYYNWIDLVVPIFLILLIVGLLFLFFVQIGLVRFRQQKK